MGMTPQNKRDAARGPRLFYLCYRIQPSVCCRSQVHHASMPSPV